MKKVLVIHSDIFAGGGAEQVAINVINLLSDIGCEVDLLTESNSGDKTKVGLHCGQVEPVKINNLITWKLPDLASVLLRGKTKLLKYSISLMKGKAIANNYDLVVSNYGEITWKSCKNLQFIQFPLFFSDEFALKCLGFQRGQSSVASLFRVANVKLCRLITRWCSDQVQFNTTIVNSYWSRKLISKYYTGIRPVVIYPGSKIEPSIPNFSEFSNRSNDFVILGRIEKIKEIEKAIAIVSRLRSSGINSNLHIVGRGAGNYLNKITKIAAQSGFCFIHCDLDEQELKMFLKKHRWGIHCFEFEHYGVAPADLIASGCITFVPSDGGQTEIVDLEALQYSCFEDAIDKITNVINNPDVWLPLLSHLYTQSQKHQVSQFYSCYKKVAFEKLYGA